MLVKYDRIASYFIGYVKNTVFHLKSKYDRITFILESNSHTKYLLFAFVVGNANMNNACPFKKTNQNSPKGIGVPKTIPRALCSFMSL